MLAVLELDNGAFKSLNIPNKNFISGDLAGEFVAKMDRDQKSDWLFKNRRAVYVVNLDETDGIEIENIIQTDVDINGWKLQDKDIFVSAGNFSGHANEQQLLIVAGK